MMGKQTPGGGLESNQIIDKGTALGRETRG